MSDNKPLISIIIPVYNAGRDFLRAAVASALNQSYRNTEVIVVNDASTDDSMTALDDFSDVRLQVVQLGGNSGPSAARNAGVDVSKGRWVCFLDADDRMLPSMCERLLKIAEECDADIAACNFCRVAPGEELPTSTTENDEISIAEPKSAIAIVLYQTGTLNNSPCGKLYRREICMAAPGLPGRYEDLRLFYRHFLLCRRIAWTDEPLYAYTDNPSSYLHCFTPERAVVLDVVEEMVEFMESEHPDLLPPARDRALSAAFNILKLMRANHLRDPQIAERCRGIIRQYRRQSLFNPRVRLKNKAAIIASYLGGLRLI